MRLHEQCFDRRDAGPLAEGFIAPDALWDFQGFPPTRGRTAVLAFFEEKVRISRVAIAPLSWRGHGDTGWSLVDYHVTFDDGAAPLTLRTMFVWVRLDGDWLVEAATGHEA